MSILDVPGISKAQLEARVTGITDEVVEARDMAQAFAIDSLGAVIESHAIVLQAPLDADAKVEVFRKSLISSTGSKVVGHTPVGEGSVASDVGLALRNNASGGLGDFSVDNKLLIFCGDSTTEQMTGSGFGFDRMTTLHRKNGGRFSKILGTINFGGSGYQLNGFVNDPAVAPPVIQMTTNAGLGVWDAFGHKPVGAISLGTALAWRALQASKVVWINCFGINDCILVGAVGNLDQPKLTDYLVQRLRKMVSRINAAFPEDEIVLQIPNPMTARPFNPAAGFPSASAYPSFGSVDATDQALVEKWNQSLRAAYLEVRANFPRTILFDTWDNVFGQSNTTLLAGTELKFLNDLVHPSGPGYVRRTDALVNLLAPEAPGRSSRRVEADLRATALGGDPWAYYPHYFRDNPAYRRILRLNTFVGIGTNYFDLFVDSAAFSIQIDTKKPIYVAIGGQAAQMFTTYTPGASGANTRLTGVAPSAAMQAAIGEVEIFQLTSTAKSTDPYLVGQIATIRPRELYTGKVTAAGVGYLDVTLDAVEERPSTKYIDGVLAGKLLIGGGADTTLALSTFTVNRLGATSDRAFRLLKTGTYTAYAGKACAVSFDDAAASPRIHETVFVQRNVIPHVQNGRGFVHCPVRMLEGATLQAFLSEIIAQPVTVEVYKVNYPTRTLVGTITIPANVRDAVLTTGNPTEVLSGSIYEFVITSATSQSTGVVGLAILPV